MQAVRMDDHFTIKKIIQFVLPGVGMMLVTSIYSIVDGFFVSNFAGKNAFAAVNLVIPAIMLIGSIGFMVGSGGSALVSFTFGIGDEKRGREQFSMLITALTIAGVILSVLGILFMPQIVDLLGASDVIRSDAILYGRILMASVTPFMLQNSFQSFLMAAERAALGFKISIAAGVMNMVLDFLLVYVCGMGILGAALATALSQITGAVIPLFFFAKDNGSRLRFTKFRFSARVLGKACGNGTSEMVTNISMSVVSMVYNIQLMKLAAENGIAAYGVIMYVGFIFQAMFLGYSMGINPLVGFNYGAERKEELHNLLTKSLRIIAVAGVAMLVLSEVFSGPVSRLYVGYDADLCAMTIAGFHIFSISFLISGFNIFASAFFTGLGNGAISATISVLRTLVFQLICVIVLPILFGLNGIWFAVSVAEVGTLIISFWLIRKYRSRYGY